MRSVDADGDRARVRCVLEAVPGALIAAGKGVAVRLAVERLLDAHTAVQRDEKTVGKQTTLEEEGKHVDECVSPNVDGNEGPDSSKTCGETGVEGEDDQAVEDVIRPLETRLRLLQAEDHRDRYENVSYRGNNVDRNVNVLESGEICEEAVPSAASGVHERWDESSQRRRDEDTGRIIVLVAQPIDAVAVKHLGDEGQQADEEHVVGESWIEDGQRRRVAIVCYAVPVHSCGVQPLLDGVEGENDDDKDIVYPVIFPRILTIVMPTLEQSASVQNGGKYASIEEHAQRVVNGRNHGALQSRG